ncbi:MAG: rod shape-determining protein MreD [Lachnospiraceae bacterium]|nr:rod shape-determining protein MreD [Lachnospiraceae bacterium]
MKKFIINFLLLVVFFVLQTTVFNRLTIVGVMPNILIILICVTGFMQGDKTACILGFFAGLLVDLFSFRIIGFHALLYCVLGFVTGQFHNTFYPEDFKLPLLVITGGDLGCSLLTYFFTYLFRSRFHFGFYFLNVTLPELAYTLFVGLLIYPLFLLLYRFVLSKRIQE